jgi:hypothetical protein
MARIKDAMEANPLSQKLADAEARLHTAAGAAAHSPHPIQEQTQFADILRTRMKCAHNA